MINLFSQKIILAPMAGISESVYRTINRQQGADIVVSEMVSSEGLHYNAENTKTLAKFNECERPLGIQIFGSNPEKMAEGAKYIEDNYSPDFIDINSGCPVPKVTKKNGGSALLKNPILFGQIIESMVKACKTPITVKIRSGWNIHEWVDIEFAKIAQESGASAIALHPRSKTMLYSGKAFWERITEVKKAVSIPVIGNGDIIKAEDAKKMFEETNCDSIMIGRGTYGNPWIFNQIKSVLAGQEIKYPTLKEKIDLAELHLKLYKERYGIKKAEKDMKKHIAWYIKGVPGATIMRDKIFRTENYNELIAIMNEIKNSVNKAI